MFWNGLTIHGSLDSQDPEQSRSSITCHAIPSSRRLLHHQTLLWDVATDLVNETRIFRPKDLAAVKNRVIFGLESPAALAILLGQNEPRLKQVFKWKIAQRVSDARA